MLASEDVVQAAPMHARGLNEVIDGRRGISAASEYCRSSIDGTGFVERSRTAHGLRILIQERAVKNKAGTLPQALRLLQGAPGHRMPWRAAEDVDRQDAQGPVARRRVGRSDVAHPWLKPPPDYHFPSDTRSELAAPSAITVSGSTGTNGSSSTPNFLPTLVTFAKV